MDLRVKIPPTKAIFVMILLVLLILHLLYFFIRKRKTRSKGIWYEVTAILLLFMFVTWYSSPFHIVFPQDTSIEIAYNSNVCRIRDDKIKSELLSYLNEADYIVKWNIYDGFFYEPIAKDNYFVLNLFSSSNSLIGSIVIIVKDYEDLNFVTPRRNHRDKYSINTQDGEKIIALLTEIMQSEIAETLA